MAKTGSLSKLEYLKKYMDDGGNDNNKKEKKVKKKKKVKKITNIKIIDNAIPLKNIDTNMNSEEEEEYELQEEKPLMYAEDGMTMFSEQLEDDRASRWKPLKKDIETSNSSKKLNRASHRHDSSDSDMSPERPKKLSQGHNSDCDMSPVRKPRNQNRHDSSGSDLSPVRRDPNSDDMSPVRRKRHDSDNDDMSPVRRKQGLDSDLSPKRTGSSKSSNKRKELQPEVLSSGKGGGLKTGAELKRENDLKRKREKEIMENLHVDLSGKGAETIRRDKSGMKIDSKLETIKKRKQEEEELEHQEKYARWGKGLAQVNEFQNKIKDDLHEMDKPLARYKDDQDLDVLLRERDREGDPMLAFLSKGKTKVNTPAKPRYNGPTPAPNRFNIWPGYRYDGVDRSNGFEKRRFSEINKQKTHKTAAYKWSVEDM